MARYATSIEVPLLPEEAFGYMAEFANTLEWDPGVVEAERLTPGSLAPGSAFRVVTAFLGARVALCTHRLDRIGEMSCNPAIGGLGKGQLAREVDALGGAMGRAIDATGIQFRMLNTAKGYAVQAPRAQADRHLYREEVTRVVRAADGVELVEGAVAGLVIEGDPPAVRGVTLQDGRELRAAAVILTTLIAPVMLQWAIPRAPRDERHPEAADGSA